MVNQYTVAEFAHVLFGMMWVGVSIYIELVLAPMLKKAEKVGDLLRLLPIMGKTSLFQMLSGLLVLATGAVYLLLLFPLDVVLTISSGQLVVVGLVLVLVALINGMVFLKPVAGKLIETKWPEDPNAPIPESVVRLRATILAGSVVNTVIVVVVLFLMVAAANGGL